MLIDKANKTDLDRQRYFLILGVFNSIKQFLRLACQYDKAVEVFEDPQMARKWLKEPSWALGDVTPLQYADTELGAQEVEDLLGRIEHGVFT
jgi:putative toxin-antitoxin system antitoxin component (TIGR02293 family)